MFLPSFLLLSLAPPTTTGNFFGLKTLNENNKVFFNTTDGDHLDFETDFLLDLVGTYFV